MLSRHLASSSIPDYFVLFLRCSQQRPSSTPSAARGPPLEAPGQALGALRRLRKEGGAGPAFEQAALSSSAQLSTEKQV